MRSFQSHGKAGAINEELFQGQLKSLKSKVSRYAAKDVFCPDETGLFYSMHSGKTIATQRLPERKTEKKLITTLPCCNMDMSDNLELMFIGKAFKSMVFNKRVGNSFDLIITLTRRFGWRVRFS